MASSSTSDKSNAAFFDKACSRGNQGDYLVPYNKYDPESLPLTLEPISIQKTKETIVYVKPVFNKLDGTGPYKDLCIMTGPSRVIFDVAPFSEKKANDYKPLTEDIMDTFYATIKAGESKSLDICLDVPGDLIKFCSAIDEKVKKFVLDHLDLYPNLDKISKKNGQVSFYPSVITKAGKDQSLSSHLKAKLIFRNGEYDLRAFDSDKKPTSIRANRNRLKGGTVNALLRFGNIWSNALGAFGASWKVIGGHFEFASPVEPASFDDLFSAYSSTYGSKGGAAAGAGGSSAPKTVSLKAAQALGVDVSDDDDDEELEEEEETPAAKPAIAAATAAVDKVAVKEDSEEEEEEDDEEEDDEDDEEEAKAIAAAEEAKRAAAEAEAKRVAAEAEAAAAAAASTSAKPKAKKGTKKAAAAAE